MGWRALRSEDSKLGKDAQIGSVTTLDSMSALDIEDGAKVGFGRAILGCPSIDRREGKLLLERDCRMDGSTVMMSDVAP